MTDWTTFLGAVQLGRWVIYPLSVLAILAITIVGLLVVPFVGLGMVLFAVASFGLPIGMVVFGLIAAWEAYQGKRYQVPYLGRWIEQQMHGGFLTHF